ncbi:DUF2093 domain-containing protein [Asticcacaulis sp. BYS171W]|uniref:DUF2093 domain-containing protein n=1 Tax=Asticcacaulis aquaticus TaxID=2984212 RepID=A0ABT5HXY9_9CAUL|nr:DUF2093 domain-containing protein [Asticcacaulis aquaticus]MDC7684947.1 DUF2093 domain-containing protein [Asticcacaulis aquaticus]
MNMHAKPSLPDQAVLHYGDGEYAVMRPGKFVICAVSGKQIPLEALRYWNPRTQEAYAGPQEATAQWKKLNGQ